MGAYNDTMKFLEAFRAKRGGIASPSSVSPQGKNPPEIDTSWMDEYDKRHGIGEYKSPSQNVERPVAGDLEAASQRLLTAQGRPTTQEKTATPSTSSTRVTPAPAATTSATSPYSTAQIEALKERDRQAKLDASSRATNDDLPSGKLWDKLGQSAWAQRAQEKAKASGEYDAIMAHTGLLSANTTQEKDAAFAKILEAEKRATDIQTADTQKGWLGKSIGAGLQQTQAGIDNAAATAAEILGATELARGQRARSDSANYSMEKQVEQALKTGQNQGVSEDFVQAGIGVGQQLNSVIAGLANPLLGGAVTGVSAFGNYANEALQDGASKEDAALYGAIGGSLEFVTDSIFGKLLNKLIPFGAADGVAGSFTKNTVKNIFRIVKGVGYASLENAVSEGGIEPLLNVAKGVTYKPEIFEGKVFGEGGIVDPAQMWQSAKVGAMTGGVFAGGGAITSLPGAVKAAKNIADTAPGVVMAALGMPETTQSARQAAELVKKNQSGQEYSIGDLQSLYATVRQELPKHINDMKMADAGVENIPASAIIVDDAGLMVAGEGGTYRPVNMATMSDETLAGVLSRPEFAASSLPIAKHRIKAQLTAVQQQRTAAVAQQQQAMDQQQQEMMRPAPMAAQRTSSQISQQEMKIADLRQQQDTYGTDMTQDIARETNKLAAMQADVAIETQRRLVDDLSQQVQQYEDPKAQSQLAREQNKLSGMLEKRAKVYQSEMDTYQQEVVAARQQEEQRAQEQTRRQQEQQATQQQQEQQRRAAQAETDKQRTALTKARAEAVDTAMPLLLALEKKALVDSVDATNAQSMGEWQSLADARIAAQKRANELTPADIYRKMRMGALSAEQETYLQRVMDSELSPKQEAAIAQSFADELLADEDIAGDVPGIPEQKTVPGVVGRQTPVDRGTPNDRVATTAKKPAQANDTAPVGRQDVRDGQDSQGAGKDVGRGAPRGNNNLSERLESKRNQRKSVPNQKERASGKRDVSSSGSDLAFIQETIKDTSARLVAKQTTEQKAVAAIFARLGTKVVWFRSDAASVPNGFFAAAYDKDVLFLRERSLDDFDGTDNPFRARNSVVLWTAGHEFLHYLSNNYPDAYTALLGAAKQIIPEADVIAYKNDPEMHVDANMPMDKLWEEYLADEMGNLLSDKTFWDGLATHDMKLFDRMVHAVRRFFRDLFYDSGRQSLPTETTVLRQLVPEFEKAVAAARRGALEQGISKSQRAPVKGAFSMHPENGDAYARVTGSRYSPGEDIIFSVRKLLASKEKVSAAKNKVDTARQYDLLNAYYQENFAGEDFNEYATSAIRYINKIKRLAGKGLSAIRANAKTLVALDPSMSCTMKDGDLGVGMPCVYCYVENPRTWQDLGGKMPSSPMGEFQTLPYVKGDLAKMDSHLVTYMNDALGGIRMFSGGDWHPNVDNLVAEMIEDAGNAKGVNGEPLIVKAITKQQQFVEKYISTEHLRFNLSTDFLYPEAFSNTKLRTTLQEARKLLGFGWDIQEATSWKEKHPDRVRVRYVALNAADAILSVIDPRIDITTMYHGFTKPDILLAIWRRKNQQMFDSLGEDVMTALAHDISATPPDSMKKAGADKKGTGSQRTLDRILGENAISEKDFWSLAEAKMCCQTHKCGDCTACCGFKAPAVGKMMDGKTQSAIAVVPRGYTGKAFWRPDEPQFSLRDTHLNLKKNHDVTHAQAAIGAAALQGLDAKFSVRATDVPEGAKDVTKQARTIAKDYTSKYMKKGAVSFIGKQIANAGELATIAQVLRDPRFETFRVFFVDDTDTVVHQTAVTSRVPGMTRVTPDGPGTDSSRMYDMLVEAMPKGATGFYMLHNHPSGDITPSRADYMATARFHDVKSAINSMGPKLDFLGHVIINGNKYTHINKDKLDEAAAAGWNTAAFPAPDVVKLPGADQPDKLRTPEVPHYLLGTPVNSPDRIAYAGFNLKQREGYSTLMYVSPGLKLRGAQEIDNFALTADPKLLKKIVTKSAVDFGGQKVALVTDDFDTYQQSKALITDGILLDVIFSQGHSVISAAAAGYSSRLDSNYWMGKKIKGVLTKEALREYDTRMGAIEEAFKDSKVRNEDGSLKMVLHGTSMQDFTAFDPAKVDLSGLSNAYGGGFYFTDDSKTADAYRVKRDVYGKATSTGKGRVIEAYLNITNPATADSHILTEEMVRDIANQAKDAWRINNVLKDIKDQGGDFGTAYARALFNDGFEHRSFGNAKNDVEVLKALMKLFAGYKGEQSLYANAVRNASGIDGVIAKVGGKDSDINIYVPLFPEQIKSPGGDNPVDLQNADIRFSTRAVTPPKKTVTAYKAVRLDPKQPGKIFPLFVDSTTPFPIDTWFEAEEGPWKLDVRGRKRVLADTGEWTKFPDGTAHNTVAYRPGLHAGDLPYMPQILVGKGKNKQLPENVVFIEIEMGADVDYTNEAVERSRSKKTGKPNVQKIELDRIPQDGFYRRATNPLLINDPNQSGAWMIGHKARVVRILPDAEVRSMVEAAGYKAPARRGGDLNTNAYTVPEIRAFEDLPDTWEENGAQYSKRSTDTEAFRRWFQNSKVVDVDGNPLVVYHGTTHEFTAFSGQFANAENHHGAGQYFSSSPVDVSANYAGVGPDLSYRISLTADRLITQGQEDFEEQFREAKGLDEDDDIDYDQLQQYAQEIAKQQLKGEHNGAIIPAYLSLQNPVVVGSRDENTRFDYGWETDDDGELVGEPAGEAIRLIEVVRSVGEDMEVNDTEIESVISELHQIGQDYDEITTEDFEKVVREADIYWWEDTDETGPGEFINRVYQELGFDGIILRNARNTFRNMNLQVGTDHFVVFDNRKIKSAIGNSGTFDPANPDIRYSMREIHNFDEPAVTSAVDLFGLTFNPEEAGYLLKNGRMLDFSGKKNGARGGQRTMDHREIRDAFPETDADMSQSDYLAAFQDMGNIRMYGTSGFELSIPPSQEQEAALRRLIPRAKEGLYVDLVRDGQHNSAPETLVYPRGVRPDRVINDIRNFFATGEVQQSDVANFHAQYSNRVLTKTTEFKGWFGDSKVVDRNGNPLVVYHGTDSEFFAFEKEKRGEKTRARSAKRAFFFTDNAGMADTYRVRMDNFGTSSPYNMKPVQSFVNALSDENLERLAVAFEDETGAGVWEGVGLNEQGNDLKKWTVDAIMNFFEVYERSEGIDGLKYSMGIVEKYVPDLTELPGWDAVTNALNEKSGYRMDAYLKIENPLVIDDLDEYEASPVSSAVTRAIEEGHDGVIFRNMSDGFWNADDDKNPPRGDVYAVFEPTQIKSASQNTGAFDPANPDIRSSRRSTTIPTANIPQQGERRERGYSENTATNTNMHQDLQNFFSLNPLKYRAMMNKDTLDAAIKKFNNIKNFEQAYSDYISHLDKLDPSDVPLGGILANHFENAGQHDKAVELISAIAEKLTQAGRFSQAAIILRDTGNPAYMLRTLARQIDKLNEQGLRLYPGKWEKVELLPQEIQALNDAFDGAIVDKAAWNIAVQSIHDRIAQSIPVTKVEQFNAWRRMAMLLNVKTHVRNVVGNGVMLVNSHIKDAHATVIERMFVKDRALWSHSMNWADDKSRVAITERYWAEVKDDLRGIHKYEVDKIGAFQREKTIFGKGFPTRLAEKLTGKTYEKGILESVNKGLSWLLDAGDVPFMEAAFKRGLGMELKAQGMLVPTEAMIERAKERAMEDTFKQMNGLSHAIRNAKAKGGRVGLLVEAAVPFERTPSAIAKLGIQYSPYGLIEATGHVSKALFAKDASVKAQAKRDTVDIFSKVLTGTELIGLGFALAMMGLARGLGEEKGKEEALQEQLLGKRDYTILLPWGGSYTFDWLQPSAIPVAIGATLGTALQKKGKLDLASITEAALTAGDTVFNLSMLQNIRGVLGNSYDSPTTSVAEVFLDYFEQAVPTVAGAATRVADPVRRMTYQSGDFFGNFARGMQAKTIWSKYLPKQYDVFGREVLHNRAGGDPGNTPGLTNVVNQFLSPGNYTNAPEDAITEELLRLYNQVEDTDILPRTAPTKSFQQNNIVYELTLEEKSEFQRIMGQGTYRELKALMNTTRYKNGVDDTANAAGGKQFVRSKEIAKVIERNYQLAKDAIIKNRGN